MASLSPNKTSVNMIIVHLVDQGKRGFHLSEMRVVFECSFWDTIEVSGH